MAKDLKRFHMPMERRGITQRFKIGNYKGYFVVNEFVRGGKPQPGELFLWMAKEGGTLSGLINVMSILISLCLQYGVPLEVLCKKFIGWRFEPSGYVEGTPEIPYALSIVDYVFRWMAIHYLGEEWLEQLDLAEQRMQPIGIEKPDAR